MSEPVVARDRSVPGSRNGARPSAERGGWTRKRPKAVRRRSFLDESDHAELPLIERIYRARGADPRSSHHNLGALDSAERLLGCRKGAGLLADAIMAGKRILVVGDYDVDGATSTALCVLALRALGAQHVDYFVPDRFVHGYGLSPMVVAAVSERTPDLLLTVDNGISSVDGVAAARASGMAVIITDHHLPGPELPQADAIVNPNQPGCPFPWKSTAGVGVAFYLLAALRQELKARAWFAEGEGVGGGPRAEPSMGTWLDLVALGTVADVVPLEFNNRVLVASGLKRIRAGRCRPGILALLRLAGRNPARASASDLAFAVAPRLNAAGRLQDIGIGIECLLAEDQASAERLAEELQELNLARKDIEDDMREQALGIATALAARLQGLPPAFCLYDASWHQGVLGIVAARIKDQFNRPVIVLARGESGELKGSGRSIPGLHLRDVLDEVAATSPGLLSRFGGHAMAAGLTLAPEGLESFRERFQIVVAARLGSSALEAVLETDGELAAEELTLQSALAIAEAGPWGQGFPEPLFEGRFLVVDQRVMAEKHLRLRLQDPRSGRLVEGVAFNAAGDWLPEIDQSVEVVFRLGCNEYRGITSLQLVIEQLLPATEDVA